MFSAIKSVLYMSAVRYALLQSLFFALVLIVSSFFLEYEIASQIREDIDIDLQTTVAEYRAEFEKAGGPPQWYIKFDEEDRFNRLDSFQSEKGDIFGIADAKVFAQDGFQTLEEKQLFSSRYIGEFQKTFYVDGDEEFIAEGDLPADFEIAPTQWRVFVGPVPGGKIAVYVPIDEVESALELIPSIVWPIGLVIIATTLLGGLIFGYVQQKRLARISRGLAQLAEGDLSARFEPRGEHDDLDQLMKRIDQTAEQLENSVHQIKHNAQNFAHELRTPLTILRAELEKQSDGADLTVAMGKADEIIRIFDSIQRISRLSNRRVSERREDVPLNDVLKVLADLYEDVAEENGISLRFRIKSAGTVAGDRQLLIQMGSNLIENAFRHASTGAFVTVVADEKSIIVADDGPGIPDTEKDKVIQPFFRRDRTQAGQGSGLGLALVRAIADFHGADLVLEDSPHGGLCVRIRFPA